MKIKHLLLWLLVALCMHWSAKAQDIVYPDPLTLYDGSGSSSAVPVKFDNLKFGTHSQFILPKADLAALRNGTVTKLSFYSASSNMNFGEARYKVYMAEVPYNAFTASIPTLVDWDTMTEVYSGPLAVNANGVMEFDLITPFPYSGDNLMIGFREVETGNIIFSNKIWKGVSNLQRNTALASFRRYANAATPTTTVSQFLPKMTIEYCVLNLPAVVVTEDNVTANTASFSWVMPSPNVTGYKYQYNKVSEEIDNNWVVLSPTATSVTLEGLDYATGYLFHIAACYGEQVSPITVMEFATTCPDYVETPYYEDFDSYVIEDNLQPTVRTLPRCWDYINNATSFLDTEYPSLTYSSGFTYFANSQQNSLEFYIHRHIPTLDPKPQYAILPAMHNINTLCMKLYARSFIQDYTYTSTFKVGVMEETETGPEFVPIATITPSDVYQSYTIDFNGYNGNGEHIAIWMEVPNTWYGRVFIDDIAVTETPSFTRPIASHGGNSSSGWYLISSPLADATDAMNVTQLINGSFDSPDFDLYRFNPNNIVNGNAMAWENWKAEGTDHYHFDLEPGRGYLYANADNVTLNFLGTPYSSNGEVILHYDSDVNLGGWNLVGNPFPFPVNIGNRAFLRMNDNGSEFVSGTGTNIRPMEGIFVYTETDGERLKFSTVQSQDHNEQLSVSVNKVLSRNGLMTPIDCAILRFDGGDELPKFQFNEKNAKVYIPQNGLDYAVINAEGQGEMPINFRADENGTYTLSLSCENVEFSYLHLFDNKTGTDVDLLPLLRGQGGFNNPVTYTFDATTTDYESRFKLVFATGSSVAGDSFTFINSNGNFSIFGIEGEATLQVFDVMGRVLSTETFSGSIEKRLNVAPGVYFIRLLSDEDVKTQKIVVR